MSGLIAFALYCAVGVEVVVQSMDGESIPAFRDRLLECALRECTEYQFMTEAAARAIINLVVAVTLIAVVLLWLPILALLLAFG